MAITYDEVKKYRKAGLCIIPTHRGLKRPALTSWQKYEKQFPLDAEIREWFAESFQRDGMGIVCGKISGFLEVIDFDKGAQEFENWKENVPEELFNRLCIENTVSGGKHVFYRANNISGSQKLAMEDKTTTLIETRGEGGFIKCSPSAGYEIVQGSLLNIPRLTDAEREILITAARKCNKYEQKHELINIPVAGEHKTAAQLGNLRPGDDYTLQSTIQDFENLLERLGWTFAGGSTGGNRLWTRPNKDVKDGNSATLKDVSGTPILYVHSTNAGVPDRKGYTIYQFRALAEFNGDFAKCSKALVREGYGEKKPCLQVDVVKSIPAGNEKIDINLSQITNPNLRDPDNYNEFPIDVLPSYLQNYIIDQANAKNQDPANVACLLLSLLGGILGASVKLQMDSSGWQVAPIIWTCIIGVSGQGKSPMIDAVKSLLDDKSDELYAKYKREQQEYLTAYNEWYAAKKKGNITPEPQPAQERKLYVTDATFEGLAKDLLASKGRLMFILDEFGSFFSMLNRTKTPGEAAKWLSGYSGGAIVTSRAGAREVRIKKAYWSMLGGTTPEKFREFIMQDGGDKDGTLSRMSLIWTPRIQEYITSVETKETVRHIDTMKSIVNSLVDFDPTQTPRLENEEGRDFYTLEMNDECKEDWEQMKKDNKILIDDPSNSTDAVAGYLAKSLELTPRIAIILHFAEYAFRFMSGDTPAQEQSDDDVTGLGAQVCKKTDVLIPPKVIDMTTWKRAKRIADWLRTENLICYELLKFVEPKNDNVKEIEVLRVISEHDDGATKKDIYQKIRRYRTKNGQKELASILQSLVDKSLIQSSKSDNNTGRPTQVYKLM